MPTLPQKPRRPKHHNSSIGKIGEELSVQYLVNKNYTIIHRNFRCATGEIDIVARKPNRALVFVEVKCRIGTLHGMPYESVTYGKLRRISRTIQYYLLKYRPSPSTLAIEVISIVLNQDTSIRTINHFENIAIV